MAKTEEEIEELRDSTRGVLEELWNKYGPTPTGPTEAIGGFSARLNVGGYDFPRSSAEKFSLLGKEKLVNAKVRELNKLRDNLPLGVLEPEDQAFYDDLIDTQTKLAALRDKARQNGFTSEEVVLSAGQPKGSQPGEVYGDPLADVTRTAEIADGVAAGEDQEIVEEEPPPKDAQTVKVSYQSFLLYNVEYFSGLHKIFLSQGSSDPESGYQPPVLNGSMNEITSIGYYNGERSTSRLILTQEEDESSAMINKFKLCEGNEEFSKIRTSEYAQLVPMLKIHKVFRNQRRAGDLSMVEMEFSNRTSKDGIEEALTEVSVPVGKSTRMYSKGVECGIKSFNWSFIGQDTFTATRDIEASMTLFFQHFSTLSKERRGRDLLADPSDQTKIAYKYLDLIVQPDCRDYQDLSPSAIKRLRYSNAWRPECYEIKVDVGYAMDGEVHDFSDKLKRSICCQKDSLYLTPTSHTFDFKNDGTIELSINYKGRLENIMNDNLFNVLMPGGGFYNIDFQDSEGKTTSIQKIEDELIAENYKQEPDKDRIKKLEREKAIFFTNYRQIFYGRLMYQMEELGYVHQTSLSADQYFEFAKWRAGAGDIQLPPPMTPLSEVFYARAGEGSTKGVMITNVDASTVAPDSSPSEKLKEKNKTEDFDQRLIDATEASSHTVNYFFLGDLIATVAASVFGDYLFLSSAPNSVGSTLSINTSDPTLKTSLKDIIDNFTIILGNLKVDVNGKEIIINLANMPVSLELFASFLRKNILSQDVVSYSFTEFLDDVISYVINAMSIGAHHAEGTEGLVSLDSRVSTTLFTTQAEINEQVFVNDPYKKVSLSKINPTKQVAFDLCNKDKIRHRRPYDYLIINAVNSIPESLAGTLVPDDARGDKVGDRARGILHFTHGENRGLMKRAKFSKTDQEYLPESLYLAEGDYVFNQLANVYDVNFEMLGNNLFRNGMLLYFDPSPMGTGMPWQRQEVNGEIITQSWANVMGLGGYHLVTRVDHSITPGSYTTAVKARWQTGGSIASTVATPEAEVRRAEIAELEAQRIEDQELALLATLPDAIVALAQNAARQTNPGVKAELQKEITKLNTRLQELKAKYNK